MRYCTQWGLNAIISLIHSIRSQWGTNMGNLPNFPYPMRDKNAYEAFKTNIIIQIIYLHINCVPNEGPTWGISTIFYTQLQLQLLLSPILTWFGHVFFHFKLSQSPKTKIYHNSVKARDFCVVVSFLAFSKSYRSCRGIL